MSNTNYVPSHALAIMAHHYSQAAIEHEFSNPARSQQHLSRECWKQMEDDCREFLQNVVADQRLDMFRLPEFYVHLGRSFFRVRNGYSESFDDEEWPMRAVDVFDNAIYDFAELSLYFGQDGAIHSDSS